MKYLSDYFEKMRGGKKAPPRASITEIFWSSVGGFIGIYLIYFIGHYQALHLVDSLFLVGSFGATAVLLYGVPNSSFSQPRNMVGGHIISAIVGVSCSLLLSAMPALAAAMAVSIAILLMHLTRTIHPPGGATAIIAVIGSEEIHRMSYLYVLTPIATGALIMLIVALLVNNISSHRQYPDYWF